MLSLAIARARHAGLCAGHEGALARRPNSSHLASSRGAVVTVAFARERASPAFCGVKSREGQASVPVRAQTRTAPPR
jgi:hypothetical protein